MTDHHIPVSGVSLSAEAAARVREAAIQAFRRYIVAWDDMDGPGPEMLEAFTERLDSELSLIELPAPAPVASRLDEFAKAALQRPGLCEEAIQAARANGASYESCIAHFAFEQAEALLAESDRRAALAQEGA